MKGTSSLPLPEPCTLSPDAPPGREGAAHQAQLSAACIRAASGSGKPRSKALLLAAETHQKVGRRGWKRWRAHQVLRCGQALPELRQTPRQLGVCSWPMIYQISSLGRSFPVPSFTTAHMPSLAVVRSPACAAQPLAGSGPGMRGVTACSVQTLVPDLRSGFPWRQAETHVLLFVRLLPVLPVGSRSPAWTPAAWWVPPRMLSTLTRSFMDTRYMSAIRTQGRPVPEPQLHFHCPCMRAGMSAGALLLSQPPSLLGLLRGRGQVPREVEKWHGARPAWSCPAGESGSGCGVGA